MKDISVCDLVVISGVRPCGYGFAKRKNGRPCHGLLYIWNGQATFTFDGGKTVIVSAGQLVYIPKFLAYEMQYTADCTTFVVLNFDVPNHDGTFLGPSDILTVLAYNDDSHTISNIMAKLEICSASQNLAGTFRRKELFYRLLSVVYGNRDFCVESSRSSPILKGVLLLKQSYLEALPIETFARESNMSISLFRQLFRKQYGMSPLQYRNLLRIHRARQLLEYDDSTVSEVAYASGFENVGYFCRCYKKYTGETPKQTRQK